jgi:hypothetical protein
VTEPNEIEFAGAALRRHRHVCAFFRNAEEEIKILLPFLKEGLGRGEKVIYIIRDEQRNDYLRRLEQSGLATAAAQSGGQLEVRSWVEASPHNGRFDPEEVAALIPRAFEQARSQGYRQTRLVGNMEWTLERFPGVHDLLKFEARVEQLLRPYDDPAVCVYDSSKFSGRAVLDILRTHPVVLVGGLLHENPFYQPPEEFLRELRARKG